MLHARDSLTRFFLRDSLEHHLAEEIDRAKHTGRPLSLLIIDLDHFKSINDAFGHLRGDEVLAELAERMRTGLPSGSLLFRYGGDEFVALLPGCDRAEATAHASTLLNGVRGTPFPGTPTLTISLSIGIAALPEDATTARKLFECADQRLYEAKRQGRGRVSSESAADSAVTDPGERILGQDVGMASLHAFLRALPIEKRGIFEVHGPPGSGRSRFLEEVDTVSRVLGFEVLRVRGQSGLRMRMYGALQEAQGEHGVSLPVMQGAQNCARYLAHLVEEKHRRGVLLVVDDFALLDEDSLELLERLVEQTQLAVLGIVCSMPVTRPWPARSEVVPLRAETRIQPLSEEGARSRIRTLLQWEPPAEFLGWLHRETQGYPGRLETGLRMLVEQEALVRQDGEWSYEPDLLLSRLEATGRDEVARVSTLPVISSSLIGRDREVQELKRLLGNHRLVTLLGPGGIGKTRLALQVAVEQAEAFAHGAYFVALESLESPDFLISAIADALRFSFSGRGSPIQQLLDYLHGKEMLLVLDNFEHMLPAVDLVVQVLRSAPGIRILATSRERLNLYEERAFELGGMSVPASEGVAGLEHYTAVQLLVRRARQFVPDFQLRPEDHSAVVRICRALEGTPLAIELAASLLRALPLQQIADEIERSLDTLTTSFRDRPERHRSLRALFEYSWELLSSAERSALRALSVLHGSFDSEAAQRIAGASLPVLTSLMDKSLLRRVGPGRYEIHGVYRVYALERLRNASGEESTVRERHCRFFAELLQRCVPRFNGTQPEGALAEIGEAIDNLRASWRWAVRHRLEPEMEWLRDGLFHYYTIRGWYQEGEAIFGWAASSVEPDSLLQAHLLARQGCFAVRISDLERGKRLLRKSVRRLRRLGACEEIALPLSFLGQIEWDHGRYRRARTLARMSLKLYRRCGDQYGVALSLNSLGAVAFACGRLWRAERLFRHSLRIRSSVGDRYGLAKCLNNLGMIADLSGRPSEARQYFRRSHAISKELGDRAGVANSLHNLGVLTRRIAEQEASFPRMREAIRLLQESLEAYRDIGSRSSVAVCLCNLAEATVWQGGLQSAKRYYREALQITREVGGVQIQLTVLGAIARLLLAQKEEALVPVLLATVIDHPAANDEARTQAEALFESWGGVPLASAERRPVAELVDLVLEEVLAEGGPTGTPTAETGGLELLSWPVSDSAAEKPDAKTAKHLEGEVLAELPVSDLMARAKEAERQAQRTDAQRLYHTALYRLRTPEEALLAVEVLRGLGRLFYQEGDMEAALDSFEASLAVAEVQHDLPGIAHALNNQATTYDHMGEVDRAFELFCRAKQMAQKGGLLQLVGMIDQNLGVVANIRGDFSAALHHYHQSLESYRESGSEEYVGYVLNNLGMLYTDLERWEEAERCYRDALESCERSGNVNVRLMVEVNRADLGISRRDYEAGLKACASAFDLAHQLGDMRVLGETHKHFGVIYRETGDLVAAETHLGEASKLARERRDLLLAAETAKEQAELYRLQRRNQDTLRSLNQAHRLFSQLRARRDLSDVDRRLGDLESTFLAIVRHWGESIESADNYTQGHCERVADYACALARAVGFDEKMLLWFRMGALLHDVGKIVVPPEVLNKPGRLSDEERALIERHPDAGVELLGDLEFPWDIRPMVRFHHEQWSGGGYPTGIAGNEIPLSARILCIADVFDALSSDRPYRAAFSFEKSLDIMKNSMTHHFDPELLQTWEHLIESGAISESPRAAPMEAPLGANPLLG